MHLRLSDAMNVWWVSAREAGNCFYRSANREEIAMAVCEVCGNDYCAAQEGVEGVSDRADEPAS